MLSNIKNALYVISGTLLRFVIFLAISATVVVALFGSQTTVKLVLDRTNVYSRFVPALIEENKKLPQQGSFSLEDPQIIEILNDSFPARDLRANTELFINQTYLWLNGETPKLTFTIDFTKNKQQFAQALTDYAFNRLERLPVCKQLPAELDPLTATCLPKNISITEAKKTYENQILTSETFLKQTVITEKDLPKNSSGQTIAEQFSYAPTVFMWLKRAPLILALVSIILALNFILLSKRKRKGVLSLSKIIMGSGVSIIIFPLLFSYVIPYFTKTLRFDYETTGTQKLLSEVIEQLSNSIDVLFITIGASVTGIGFILFSLERLTRPTTKYTKLEKASGLASSNAKPKATPKELRGKLSQETVPLQSSDGASKKSMKGKSKYRTLMNKKDF